MTSDGFAELTYEQLLIEEERWEQAFDHPRFQEDEAEQWQRGSELYDALYQMRPDEERFQNMLVHCLLELGRDFKMRGTHMRRARDIFQQVVKMDREHSLANYRLGFLHYYNEQWSSAANAFERALRRRALLSEHRINEEQAVRALCYQARAYQKLSQQTMERLRAKWSAISPTELGRTLRSLVEETEDQIFSEEPFKPYIVQSETGQEHIGEERLLQLLETNTDVPVVILSYVDAPRLYTVRTSAGKQLYVTERAADLLRCLLQSKHPVSKDELFYRMFRRPKPASNTWVKTNISRLRSELGGCFSEPMDHIIVTTKEGYSWNHELYPIYQVIYREDDIYRADFNLD
ncbi:winged helix-turn-helix domain-containing protein [Paenibacillus sp. UNC451MF]|uniref:winged helix-turn-helix domain-containing protein n=1 Tax=Paenibacillus sp. UNC451MF TaxID=1449063 RepID=UPI00048F43A7|nr:winged helix-turn-helix domain-containing protein [Paenibacillus sp. UNC451MF]